MWIIIYIEYSLEKIEKTLAYKVSKHPKIMSIKKQPKSELQELLQKQGTPVPKYDTCRTGGDDHEPTFVSKVSFMCNGVLSYFTSEGSSKQTAETNAASKALEYAKAFDQLDQPKKAEFEGLSDIFEPAVKPFLKAPQHFDTESVRICCVIDAENLHKFPDHIGQFAGKADFYAVIGEHHHLVEKSFPGATKLITPTSASNGSDTFIQMLVGSFLTSERYDCYLIATRDRFAVALIDIIKNGSTLWKPCKAFQVTRKEHLLEHLE